MTTPAPDRVYPVPPADGDTDHRFSFGLLIDVARVLQNHGYPPISKGRDLVELQLALFRFLYGSASEAG